MGKDVFGNYQPGLDSEGAHYGLGGTDAPVIIQVKPDGTVVGPDGSVDTTGTTTSGIQEAIDALTTTDLTTRYAGGGTITLAPGVYTCSGQIIIPNTGAFNFLMQGSGKVSTILKYTGSAASFIKTAVDTVTGPPGFSSLNCTFRGIGFTHVTPTSATILMRLYALNEADIDDCSFCPDAALSNGGNALNYTPSGSAVKTVGMETNGCNMVRIRNSAFWVCARGATILSAHCRVENTIFDGCRDANSAYVFSTDGSNNFLPSYGIMAGGTDMILHGCQFDGCTFPTWNDNGYIQNCVPVFEGCNSTSATNSQSASQSRVFDPNPTMDGGFTAVDKSVNGSGVVSPSTDGSIVNFVTLGGIFGNPMDVIIGGVTVFSIGANGIVLRNLTKAARNALSGAVDGQIIYQTDNTPGPRYLVGGAWQRVTLTADP